MITVEDLRKIIMREWRDMNPSQKLAVCRVMQRINPSEKNERALEIAELNYSKPTPPPTYPITFS